LPQIDVFEQERRWGRGAGRGGGWRASGRRGARGRPIGPPPRWVELVVLGQDPNVVVDGRILRARLRIPREALEPGPRGHRFHVVDFDATVPRPVVSHALQAGKPAQRAYENMSDEDLVRDPVFRAQNAYAIAARTLDVFENALGRRIPWSFAGHQLYLVPGAFQEANAFYDPDSHGVFFGYFDGDAGRDGRYTSLSHDIVAHETTHAILDGLRARYVVPGLPDQAAFHEAFADIVALLSVFALREVVLAIIGHTDAAGLIAARDLTASQLKRSALLGLGEELGTFLGQEYVGPQRGLAMRRSVELDPSTDWKDSEDWEEPHLRGEILVACVMQTFLEMWTDRIKGLRGGGDRAAGDRVAEEGATAADHLLRMVIRAIDYAPPIELGFEDFLDAILVSDAEVAPDDEHDYRGALRRSFAAFGITQPATRILEVGQRGRTLRYSSLHVDELRTSPDEVYRFIWDNAGVLGIPTDQDLDVDRIWACTRVGPDGFVVREIVATYIQRLEGTGPELRAFAASRRSTLTLPAGLDPAADVTIYGGGTIIFDQWGRAKYHQRKPLFDWKRQQRRLDYLVRHNLRGRTGDYGSSAGLAEGQRFAILHEPGFGLEERW